jgi:hypothetical protein
MSSSDLEPIEFTNKSGIVASFRLEAKYAIRVHVPLGTGYLSGKDAAALADWLTECVSAIAEGEPKTTRKRGKQ